jgi:hypothetical protein
LSVENKLELIAMTVFQSYYGRYSTPGDGEYGFAFVRWTLNVIASLISILIIGSAILVSIFISHMIPRLLML